MVIWLFVVTDNIFSMSFVFLDYIGVFFTKAHVNYDVVVVLHDAHSLSGVGIYLFCLF